MKNRLFCVMTLMAISAVTDAQVQDNFETKGAFGISESQYFDKLMVVMPGPPSSARELLSEQSVKNLMMPPRKIGQASNPIAYALAATLEYYVNYKSNFKDNLSPDYIQLNQKGDNPMLESLQFLAATGTVSAAIVQYDVNTIPSAVFSAQKYKIKNYLILFKENTISRQKLFEVRKAIQKGNPVIVEFPVGQQFKDMKNTKIWKPDEADKSSTFTYPMVAVGYDELTEQLEFLNYLGTEWGDNGYIKISYENFMQIAKNAVVLIPDDKILGKL